MKWNNHDPLQDLHSRLMRYRSDDMQPILRGRYSGFLLLRFETVPRSGGKGLVQSLDVYYDHGRGGNPEVSKGTISLERMYAEWVADIYAFGHIHKGLVDSTRSTTFIDKNRYIKSKPKTGIVIPSLKESRVDSRTANDDRTPLTRDYGEEVAWTSQTNGVARVHVDFRHHKNRLTYRAWIDRV
jgi:hypothetical protein